VHDKRGNFNFSIKNGQSRSDEQERKGFNDQQQKNTNQSSISPPKSYRYNTNKLEMREGGEIPAKEKNGKTKMNWHDTT